MKYQIFCSIAILMINICILYLMNSFLPVSNIISAFIRYDENYDPSDPRDSRTNIKVVVRLRPFTNAEKKANARRIVSMNDEDKVVIVNPNALDTNPDAIAFAAAELQYKEWAQSFRFNKCLWSFERNRNFEKVTQEAMHHTIGKDIVESVLNGVSVSCFAYGHTGTGFLLFHFLR